MWRPKSCVLTAKVHTIQEVGAVKREAVADEEEEVECV